MDAHLKHTSDTTKVTCFCVSTQRTKSFRHRQLFRAHRPRTPLSSVPSLADTCVPASQRSGEMFAVNRLRIGERDSLLASDNTASKVVTIEQHVETVQYTSLRDARAYRLARTSHLCCFGADIFKFPRADLNPSSSSSHILILSSNCTFDIIVVLVYHLGHFGLLCLPRGRGRGRGCTPSAV